MSSDRKVRYAVIERDSKLFKVVCDTDEDELIISGGGFGRRGLSRHKGKKGFYFYKHSGDPLLVSERDALILMGANEDSLTEIGKKLLQKIPEG